MAGTGKAFLAVLAGVWISCGVSVQMRSQIQLIIEALIAVCAFRNRGTAAGWLVADHIAGGWGDI